jgi:hypothetical protein
LGLDRSAGLVLEEGAARLAVLPNERCDVEPDDDDALETSCRNAS